MAYRCPNCGSYKTAVRYEHTCMNTPAPTNWFVVKGTDLPEAKGPGRSTPASVPCPDGLVDYSIPPKSKDPTTCTCPPVRASQAYCFNCRKIVYSASPIKRPVKRPQAGKQAKTLGKK
jgi:hypothetical protein